MFGVVFHVVLVLNSPCRDLTCPSTFMADGIVWGLAVLAGVTNSEGQG